MLENFYKLNLSKNSIVKSELLQYAEQFVLDVNDNVEKLNTIYIDKNQYSKLYLKYINRNHIDIYKCGPDSIVIYIARLFLNDANTGIEIIAFEPDNESFSINIGFRNGFVVKNEPMILSTEKEIKTCLMYVLENLK